MGHMLELKHQLFGREREISPTVNTSSKNEVPLAVWISPIAGGKPTKYPPKKGDSVRTKRYYLVDVEAYVPYPMKKSYRIERSGYGPAISDAIKRYRKEVGRKKIESMRVVATQVIIPVLLDPVVVEA